MPEPTYKIAQRLHERRAAVGLPKYGRHLDAESRGCMLIHALEEAADQVNYLLAEIQRRREALELLIPLADSLKIVGDYGFSDTLTTVIDLLGGRAALAQYDEILGTVAQNATVDLRDEANPQLREYRFDRYVNGKLKAEGAALVAASDREAAEKLTKLCCDHPVIMIGFAVQPTNDPRDEALRVAEEALGKISGLSGAASFLPPHEPTAWRAIDIARTALAAIRGAR